MSHCQIREADDQNTPNSLKVHSARPDGLPVCGTPVIPWEGHEMVAVATDAAVTCGRRGCNP